MGRDLLGGSAGQYTLLAELLDEEHRVAGNALVSTLAEVGTLVGPALVVLVIGLAGPVVAIGLVLRQPAVAAVLGLTVVFFAFYGPVEVALPVHVREELGAPVSLLSGYVVAFGLGALLGGVAAGRAGTLPLWPLGAVAAGLGAAVSRRRA